MKKDFLIPILVLSLICLVVSTALAGLYTFIAGQAGEAGDPRMAAIPHAEDFVSLEKEGLPGTITSVYGTTNNVGFVFIISTTGYGGEMRILCAIDPDGKILRTTTLSHSETPIFALPVFAQEPLYVGNDRSLTGINAVSGSTITFEAYRNAILDAFAAFDIVREVQF